MAGNLARVSAGAVQAASDSNRNPWIFVLVVGVVGAVCTGLGIRFWRRRWAIVDTPTSKCVALFVGRNEVTGWAEHAQVLVAPVTQAPAVWFHWVLERWVQRGKSSRWETVDQATSETPFWLVDDTGRVLVWPEDAEIHAPRVFQERAPDSGVTQLFHDGRPVADLPNRFRISEWCILPTQQLYVLGRASMRDDLSQPQPQTRPQLHFAAEDGHEGHLLVSTHSEARMARTSLGLTILNLAVGWIAATVFPATIYNTVTWDVAGPEPGSASTLGAVGGWMLASAIAYGGLLFCAYWLRLHNRLVAVKQQAANAWSLIDVALRRRHTLLPNLAEVAERYAAHERELIEAVARARAGASIPDPEVLPSDASLYQAGVTNRVDRSGAHQLLALAESYPDLRADEVFRDLARRIVDAENQVAYARAFYNDAVTVLRDRRGTFPGLLLAGAVRTPSWSLFDADEVDLSPPSSVTAP